MPVADGFKYTHIIWDWNGTLFDDAWLCIEVMNDLLAQRGLELLTPDSYEAVFDFPVIDYYRKLGFDFEREPFEDVSHAFIAGYQNRMAECRLRDRTQLALSAGQHMGVTQSILSAMEHNMLKRLVKDYGLTNYFTDVVGISNHHAAGKVETAKQWMSLLRLKPETVLFVGDTQHDDEVAQALGVNCCLIYSGHHSRERLDATGRPRLDSLLHVYGV
ncbi:MAG: HAD hydrolase-like protein [Anaerolineae bacterium]|nr:HAD hydrolase-like protein [Anaerolineae bacterium]